MTLAFLHVSSKKRCLYRDFLNIILNHTISNKLVSKVSAQKKGGGGGEVKTAINMCSNFGGFRGSPPLNTGTR